MPGFAELVLILIVVLIVFGSSKLPQIATAVGKSILRLKRGRASPPSPATGNPAADPDDDDSDG